MPFHFNYEQKYPYTDFEKINLDWILELATQLKDAAENGDFDGAPGEPGTATNGIAYFTTSDTFADIQAAVTEGQLPVLMYYNMGTPCFLYCYDHTNSSFKFGGLSNTQQLQLVWLADNTKSFSTRTLISNQSPIFYGYPTLSSSPSAGDSSNKLATTSFVQNTVTAAVQAAIEQLVLAPFSENFKQALLQLAQKVAYIDGSGQTYYQALYDALYPPINVDSITAVWAPPLDYVVYTTTPLDDLKTYLTVTVTYDDQTTAVLDPDEYVLSGALTVGVSTITVTYAGASDTFTVNVSANVIESIEAVFTPGERIFCTVDTLDDLKPYLLVTGTYTDGTTETETAYTLSGTLTAGTSTITVSYDGKTDTFTVSGVRTATKLFTNAVWHGFGSAGTVSTSESASGTLVADFNTTVSTTSYTTGVGLDSTTPTSALETFGTIKGHRVRCYYESEWTSGNSESRLLASCYLGGIAFNDTRKRNCTFTNIYNTNQAGFADILVPTSAGDFASPWNGSGTVTDSDYFSVRHYWLTSVAGQAKFTLTIYDLGAET